MIKPGVPEVGATAVMTPQEAAQQPGGATPSVYGIVRYDAQPNTTDGPIYTADGEGVILAGLFAVNTTDADATIAVDVHRVTFAAVEPLVTDVTVPAMAVRPILRMGFMALGGILLQPGDSLHVTASAAMASALTSNQGGDA